MITERTLKRWRKEALENISDMNETPLRAEDVNAIEVDKRILRLTQELLDQHLLRK